MSTFPKRYKWRAWLWITAGLLFGGIVLIGKLAPNELNPEPKAQVCEVCGAAATSFVRDADGRLHAYCYMHGETARTAEGQPAWPTEEKQAEERPAGQPADTEGQKSHWTWVDGKWTEVSED